MINLLHGDCLELMKEIPDKSIDFVLTDPPYGTTACKWDVVIPFEPMWKELNRIITDRGVIALFGQEPFSSLLRTSNLEAFKYDWIWDKVKPGAFATAKYAPLKQHEIISIFYKIPGKYSPIMENREKIKKSKIYSNSDSASIKYNDGKQRIYDKKFPKSILVESNASQKGKIHPTQKPVALLEYLIKTYTLEGETVLDFTMGSGSTGVAAKNLNRNFIGIEKDDKYFEIAKKRIEEANNV